MLYHHSPESYETAARNAAAEARDRMQKTIDNGRASAQALFEHVHTNAPTDRLARGSALRFGYASPAALKPAVDALSEDAVGLTDDDGIPVNVAALLDDAPKPEQDEPGVEGSLVMQVAEQTSRIHRHALAQIAQRGGMPTRYLRELSESDNGDYRALALEMLHTHYGKGDAADKRYLLRDVHGEVRGFLSDKYRRLDNRPLLEAFAEVCQAVGAVPIQGTVSDLRVALKAVLPIVFEPIDNEPLIIGIEWKNSDFGVCPNLFSLFIERLWCTNRATMHSAIRDIHLGRRLPDNIELSREAVEADTRANALALRDCGKTLLGPDKVDRMMRAIRECHSQKLDSFGAVPAAIKRALTKHELEEANRLFDSDEVVNLPAGKSVWRASNVLSWIAGTTKDKDRQLELERLAGKAMPKVDKVAA